MIGIKELRSAIEMKKGVRKDLQNRINVLKEESTAFMKELEYAREEQLCIQIVSKQTQEELEYQISELVSLSLQSVFYNPYKLGVDFTIRRGQTETDLYFERDGGRYDPLKSCGVGPVDVASLGLRMVRWRLAAVKSRPTLVLDEPFRHVKGIRDNEKALAMIQQMSHKLGIQILMVSDERVPRETIADLADRVYVATQKKGISSAERIK